MANNSPDLLAARAVMGHSTQSAEPLPTMELMLTRNRRFRALPAATQCEPSRTASRVIGKFFYSRSS